MSLGGDHQLLRLLLCLLHDRDRLESLSPFLHERTLCLCLAQKPGTLLAGDDDDSLGLEFGFLQQLLRVSSTRPRAWTPLLPRACPDYFRQELVGCGQQLAGALLGGLVRCSGVLPVFGRRSNTCFNLGSWAG